MENAYLERSSKTSSCEASLYEKRGCASAESAEGMNSGDDEAIVEVKRKLGGYMPLQVLYLQ